MDTNFINLSAANCFYHVINSGSLGTHYAIISIQDSSYGGFRFVKTAYCEDVLTLEFDDVSEQFGDVTLYSKEQAQQVLDFVQRMKGKVETIIVHCFEGRSRSAGIAAALNKIYNGTSEEYFQRFSPNRYVYYLTLEIDRNVNH